VTSIGRLLILPFKLVGALLEVAFGAGRVVGRGTAGMSRATARIMGVRGVIGLLVGVAVGLLFAPGPGRELRDRLRARWATRGRVSDDELAERVAFELAHAPRTWHLDQPTVTVVSGRAILSGQVVQASAGEELGRVAAAVPGVVAVDNLLEVDVVSDEPSGGAGHGSTNGHRAGTAPD
jgi:uncharacterized protein YunC (DUF1805 family)